MNRKREKKTPKHVDEMKRKREWERNITTAEHSTQLSQRIIFHLSNQFYVWADLDIKLLSKRRSWMPQYVGIYLRIDQIRTKHFSKSIRNLWVQNEQFVGVLHTFMCIFTQYLTCRRTRASSQRQLENNNDQPDRQTSTQESLYGYDDGRKRMK